MSERPGPRLSISLHGLPAWFGGDIEPMIELVRLAETKGFHFVSVADHVIMGDATDKYPYGSFPVPPEYPWYEPLTLLAALASRTTRIRMLTAILIAPLRSAVFLAKQIATLDAISKGRIEIGAGVGWQEEEYIASGVPFEGRFGRLVEQVQVWRTLWSEAPASFAGKTVAFEKLYSLPHPVQRGGVPIWLGLAPTERNVERMAELADGWLPVHQGDARQIAEGVEKIAAGFRAKGRDPATLKVRGTIQPVLKGGAVDLDDTLAATSDFLSAGVTHLEFTPIRWCRDPQDFAGFLDAVIGGVSAITPLHPLGA